MPVQLLQLWPREAVLFRDGRPFNAGQQVSARAHLPEPGTLFGAARTAGLARICDDLNAYGRGQRCRGCQDLPECSAVALAGPPGSPGGLGHPGSLRCLGTFLIDHDASDALFVPRPALLTELDGATTRVTLRVPQPFSGTWNSDVAEAALPQTIGSEGCLPTWVRLDDLAALLSGRMPTFDLPAWAFDHPDEPEPRVGLARENGVAMDAYLYRAEFRRYQPTVALAAAVEIRDGSGWAPTVFLGGRGRTADVSAADVTWPPIPPPPIRPGRYAVGIVTPAWFRSGWRPPLPEGATLASAVVPALESSQGWDLVQRRPRPMRWVCPAGSVWWVDATTREAAERIVAWHGQTLCEDRPAAGYGLAFVGRWEVTNGSS